MSVYEGFDLTQKVPIMTLLFLGLICILSIALPIFLFQLLRKKFFGRWQAVLFGVIDYVIIEIMLSNLILLGIINIPGVINYVENHMLLYILLITIIATGIDEIGRYLFLDTLYKRDNRFGSVFIFAVGIAGARSILVTASQAFQSLLIGITINNTGLSDLVTAAGENASDFLNTINPLLSNSPLVYLCTNLDVISSFLFHIAISVLFFIVVKKIGPKWLLPCIIGIRFLYELPVQLHSSGILIDNFYVAEGIVILITIIVAYFTWKLTLSYLSDDLQDLENQKAKGAFPEYNSNLRNIGKNKNGQAVHGSIRNNANIMADKKNDKDC